MNLSLAEAARLLGKSERQLRYLLKHERMPGRKENGHWVVRREDLPLTPGQERAQAAKKERAFEVAREVLGPKIEGQEAERRLCLRDLRATSEGIAILKSLAETRSGPHPTAVSSTIAMLASPAEGATGRSCVSWTGSVGSVT